MLHATDFLQLVTVGDAAGCFIYTEAMGCFINVTTHTLLLTPVSISQF